MTYSPADYLTRWEANSGIGMKHPSRHEDWRVRAIYSRRAVKAAEAALERCVNPSHEYDVASDWLWDKRKARRDVISSLLLDRAADTFAARVAA